MSSIHLKKGKDKPLLRRHHWVFSGAIDKKPTQKSGAISKVYSHEGSLLGHAYYNEKTPSISARMVSFGEEDPHVAIEKALSHAIDLRKELFADTLTTGYRLINAEGDFLPGLIVDHYQGHLVIQISTLGMEKLKDFIVKTLVEKLKPSSVWEKSTSPSRREEGLESAEGQLYGETPDQVQFLENGILFLAQIKKGQKTGFYLDQRESRLKMGHLSYEKSVFNAFSYTGGFSLYALAGGATSVTSLDSSESALNVLEEQITLNELDTTKHTTVKDDAYAYFRNVERLEEDLVIIDPPALVKKQRDVIRGARAYKDLNRIVMSKMKPGSKLLTCSCSAPVDETLFRKLIYQAALEAKREVQIIGTHPMAPDHPINPFHPEGAYLKSYLLKV